MIVECAAGHTYENIPITEGFHEIPKHCYICGAQILSAKLIGSSTITGAGGFPGMAPPSEWSSCPPVVSGWYWYKEPGRNQDQPMAAQVFWDGETLQASMFLSQGETPRRESGKAEDFPGDWCGPVGMPPSKKRKS
jgi:hypothetical protein